VAVHVYNPSYSAGRDQEDRGSKPAREGKKKLVRPHLNQQTGHGGVCLSSQLEGKL
jgi:hypothetical protein